jgi:RND superfamily putative drug exporter
MFDWWSRAVVRWRWVVLGAAAGFVAVGVTWGAGVFDTLSSGGFEDPNSESARAHERITEQLGSQDVDLVVLYSSDTVPVEAVEFREPVTDTLAELRRHPAVASVHSWYDTQAPAMISADGRATYATIRLAAAGEDPKIAAFHEVEPLLATPGVTTQVGGEIAFTVEEHKLTERDISRAELVSFPVLLVLLVFIFRGLVAAVTPLLVGGLAILGGFVATRLLTLTIEISTFAINIITLLGIGMAIDYALFVVSRFREELAAGHPTPQAMDRTLATAGRTVMVSGVTIVLALASLLIFPSGFLRSMAWGGMSAVLVAMLGSLIVLPAMLAVLGHRINTGRVRLPWRRDAPSPAPTGEGGWARLARSVMRRPVVYLLGVVVALAVLASPALRTELGGFDERGLPEGAETRVLVETLAARFPQATTDPITVLVSGLPTVQAQRFADQIAALPEVTDATITAQQGAASLVTVAYPGRPTGEAAEAAVRAIRGLPAPPGAEVLVGGSTATDLDLLNSLSQRLPWMALLIVATILILLFLAFGSVVLPVKAVLANLLSMGAAFGVVVWGFQQGHLADLLGFTHTGFVPATILLLMLAVLFGLSTDYEVFLLSRVREEWERTGDNTTAVALGLQRSGRIITAAALLLIVVVAGFATGEIAFIKLIGVGMIVMLAVDATLIRALLVPAVMRLLGRWNWWVPSPLDRLYIRYAIRDADQRVAPTASRR